MENQNASPFQAMPPAVVAVAVVLFGLEVLFQAAEAGFLGGQAGVGWRIEAIRNYGVFDIVVQEMWRLGIYPPEHLIRFVTFPMIHTGFVHAAFVCVFVLALGKMVAEAFSPLAFLAIFVLSCLAGALGFVLILDSPAPLVGGFPGAYGLIGAFTFILWVRARVRGESQYRAFSLIGVLMAVQLMFAVAQGAYGNVVSEITGFVAGFVVSFLVSPGGWRRLIAMLRQR